MEGRTNDISHLEKVCYKIIEIATSFKLENADLCLLKVVNIVNKQKIIQPRIAILPSCMALVKILTSILNGEICKCAPTDELIILLPVTLSFLNMCFERFRLDFLKHFGSVVSSYSNILLDSFLNWRSFTAGNIFQEDAGEFLPSSTHELLKGFSESLLGKAVCLLQYHFTIDNDSAMIRTRRKLFDHICSYSNKNMDLLDFDMCEIKLCSPEDSLKLINRVIAKISFCWMLLFPKEDLLHTLHTVTEGQSRKLLQGLSAEKSNDCVIIARDTYSLYMRKLELVRLLRTLYHLRVSSLSSEENTHVNSRELISLLFSCYGATMCEIDMEIMYELME
ncbi:hypothetical protein Syun_004559 [Stephania yunnanensis]|uniref:Uncharacterized protein n=1 Tax=Stephania yunnanensis TaxID=152371 RepID=A0AAP0Q0X7_9MAGN